MTTPRMAEILEEAKLADAVGLDVYAAGEHHRPDELAALTGGAWVWLEQVTDLITQKIVPLCAASPALCGPECSRDR